MDTYSESRRLVGGRGRAKMNCSVCTRSGTLYSSVVDGISRGWAVSNSLRSDQITSPGGEM